MTVGDVVPLVQVEGDNEAVDVLGLQKEARDGVRSMARAWTPPPPLPPRCIVDWGMGVAAKGQDPSAEPARVQVPATGTASKKCRSREVRDRLETAAWRPPLAVT